MFDTIRRMAALDEKAVTSNDLVVAEPAIHGPGRGHRISNRAARTHTEAYGGREPIDWVMDCVELYAQTASNAEWHLERNGTVLHRHRTPETPAYEREAPQDLVTLMEEPNPWTDYSELIELSVIDFLLAGEFMWLKFRPDPDGKPLALYRLAPSLVEIELNAKGVPGKYIYHPPSGDPVPFDPWNVVHCKRPNPHNPWRGLGIIAGGPRVYDMDLALVEQTASYYEKGTVPSGTVETDRSIPDNSLAKIRRSIRGMYGGPRNAGEVVLLQRGLKYNPVSATARDAQLREMAEHSLKRIAKMFRVPPVLLGEVGGSTDRQAVREAQRIFDNKIMRPFLNRMQKQISRGLTQAWGVDFVFDYEYIMPIEDKVDLADKVGALPGVKVREVRDFIDLGPTGDDEVDEMVLNLPGESTEDPEGFPDPSNPEGGRPPNRENTKQIRSGPQPAGARVRQPVSAAAKAMLERSDELRAKLDDDGEA
jgi:HK97 family phage portal protein